MKYTRRDGVRFDAFGAPNMTKRQVAAVHRYVIEVIRTGASKRPVPDPFVMVCAVYELGLHAMVLQRKLEQFIIGTASAAPAREVARLAFVMLTKLKELPDDDARRAYLSMMMGDDDEPGDATPPQPTTMPNPGKAH